MDQVATILGDGQMAMVVADALSTRGASVRIWCPVASEVAPLAKQRRSSRLPEVELSETTEVTADQEVALRETDVVISAIPTQFLRSTWTRIASSVPPGACIVSVTKGIENDTLLRPTELIQQILGKGSRRSICVLSGPSIAAELARHMPASLVAASVDQGCAKSIQDLLNVPWLRIYRNDDVVGVEVAGATKNVIALAAGMIDGLEAGANAKSALLARGLAEIARLGMAMGAKIDTFFGVAGVGDLATTCFSPEGRNRTCGERLARGESLDAILKTTTSVIEGVATTKSVVALARSLNIEMPITTAVHAILFECLSPRDAIRELMKRELKVETVG